MFFEKNRSLFIGRFAPLFRNPVVFHGFSTRKGGVSPKPHDSLNLGSNTHDEGKRVTENRDRFYRAMSIREENAAIPQQVHGDRIVQVEGPGPVPETDGLVTNSPGTALVVQVADCLPVYLFDPHRKAVGLVHAGWRGSRLQIVSKAVAHMGQYLGTNPRDLLAFLGPSIGPCCYDVGAEVGSQFPNKYVTEGRLDLWHCNLDQLTDAGIQPERVSMSRLCTVCHARWFFSHRSSGGNTGRMMAIVGLGKKALDIEE